MSTTTFSIEFVGWDQMDAMMKNFGPEFTRKCVIKGVWEAAQFLAQEMRSRCPVGGQYETRYPGEMRDAIDVLAKPYKSDHPSQVGATISPLYDKSLGDQSPGYYCTFVEYGSVHNPTPDPFERPTMDEAGQEAIEICIETVAAELEKMSMDTVTATPGEIG